MAFSSWSFASPGPSRLARWTDGRRRPWLSRAPLVEPAPNGTALVGFDGGGETVVSADVLERSAA
jgi:hypothetical protein